MKTTDQQYKYTTKTAPNNNRKKQEKIINDMARQGWEYMNTRLGGGWTKVTIMFRRAA